MAIFTNDPPKTPSPRPILSSDVYTQNLALPLQMVAVVPDNSTRTEIWASVAQRKEQ